MFKRFFALTISLLAILILATSVLADPYVAVGGDFQLNYSSSSADTNTLTDQTTIPWWEFDATAKKKFGDHGSAYLMVEVYQSTGGKVPNSLNGSIRLRGVGYTYKVNDQLSFTGQLNSDGEALADTQVMNDSWYWTYTLTDGRQINMHNSVFQNRTEIKMDATPIQGLNLTLGYVPQTLKEDDNRLGEAQYLIKGKYSGQWFNISAGYTNTRWGYEVNSGAFNQYRPLWAVSGEIFPSANFKLYGEYLDGDFYLVKGNARFDRFTLKATYGDIGYSRVGHPTYKAFSLDSELDYELSGNKTLITGLAYYLDTGYDGLATATAGLALGPLTVEAQHDFDSASINPNPSTTLIGKYNLDGTNSLEADFNLDKEIYSVSLYIYF